MSRLYTKDEIKAALPAAVQNMISQNEPIGTYHWKIKHIKQNVWAIVLGYSDGFEPEPNNPYRKGDCNLCIKLAFQPNNSVMQCDYDIDWLMPYEDNGDVDDTELTLSEGDDLNEAVDWLFNQFKRYEE